MSTKNYLISTINRHKVFEKIINTCQNLLYEPIGEKTLNYLNTRFNKKYHKEFGFGYFPNNQQLDLLNIPLETLNSLKLAYEYHMQDQYNTCISVSTFNNHSLVFPIKDDFGYIVGLCGRTILTEEERKEQKIDKYKYSPHSKSHVLYGLNIAKESISINQSVILVEGQFDAMSCYTKGFFNVVGLGGTSLSNFQFYLLRKYGGPNLKIKCLLDNDENLAGSKAFDKIKYQYQNYANITALQLPNLKYKDIDSYLKAETDLRFLI